jgi:Cu/Ag efflux pump CusA
VSRWISRSSLRFARLVVAAAAAALILGVVQLRAAAVDVYPQFGPPTVQVQTEALGLSAAEVEQFVTVPLEQDLLNGVPWLATIHSRSQPGLSAIDLIFDDGTDVQAARQMVQERLTQAHALPNVGSPPVMVPTAATAARVAMVGLSSRTLSPVELSVLARWRVRPKLMGVPGVADISIFGQRDRQLQVRVDPARLNRDKVSLNQVIQTTGNALWVSPLTFVEASTPGTGGFVESGNQRLAIQHISPISTPQQLAAVPVEGAPNRLRLGDVAEVVEDHQPLIGDVPAAGAPGLVLVVQKTPGADTLAVTRGIEKALDEMRPGMSGVAIDTQVYRPASYLETALRTLGLALAIGLLLMLTVMALLGAWRAAVLAAVTVPLSVIGAAGILSWTGAQLTTMTVLGLAVAAVFAVDDAVLAGDAASRPGTSRADVAGRILHSRAAVGVAAVIVALAGLPLLALGALPRAFLAPALTALVVGLAVSTLVGLTLTPVVARLLAPSTRRAVDDGAAFGRGPLSRLVAPITRRTVSSRPPRWIPAAVAAGVLALAGAVAALPQLGQGHLLPTLADRDLLVRLDAAPATSLPEMDRITGRVAADLRSLPGVAAVGSHVGRAVASDQIVDVNAADVWLRLSDGADRARTETAVRSLLHGYPGLATHVGDYTGGLLDQAGRGNDLVVRVYGDDLTQLRRQAEAVKTALGSVAGVVAPRVDPVVSQPTVDVQVDLAVARAHGLKPGDVRRDATTLTSGLIAGNLYEQSKVFDVVVLGTPAARASLQALRGLGIDSPDGTQVALGDVASVKVHPEPSVITHDDVSRSIAVTAAINGRDANAVSDDVRAKVAALPMPREFSTRVLGEATVRQDAFRWTLGLAAAVILVAFLAVQALTRNWRRAALLLGLPILGGAGAVAAAPLAGGITSAGALTGLAAILALTLRSALVTDAELTDADAHGDVDSRPAMVGAVLQRRNVAVLTTALAVAAVLVPAAVLGSRAGLELLHPLAVSALGGLGTSCLVLLFLLPPLLLRTHAPKRARPPAEPPAEPAADVPATADGARKPATRAMPVAPRLPADDMTATATTDHGDEGNDR